MGDNVKPFLRTDLNREGAALAEVLRHNFKAIEKMFYNQTTNNDTADDIDTDLTAHIADVADPHNVTKTQVALSNVVNTLHKFNATSAPGVNDDSGDGYSVGSMVFDITNDKAYGCLDPTATAAVWTELTQSGGGGSTFTTDISVSMSADWSLANNSVLKMAGFDTVDWDANLDWDAVNKRWGCPVTGKYIITIGLEIASSSTGIRKSYAYIDGVRASGVTQEPHASQGCSWVNVKKLSLTLGEYIEVYAYQDSGSAKNIIAGVSSYFQIHGPILT